MSPTPRSSPITADAHHGNAPVELLPLLPLRWLEDDEEDEEDGGDDADNDDANGGTVTLK